MVPGERWGESVRAAVVRVPGSKIGEAELTRFCHQRIAGNKVPARIVFLAELPMTGSGRVSKRWLRASSERT